MIRKVINVKHYWKVIVYYNINYNFFNVIHNELYKYNLSDRLIKRLYRNLYYNSKAVTISVYKYRISIVLLNKHKSYDDLINSIIHEAEHVKQSMLYYYKVHDSDEPPAYTVGYVATQMLMPVL